MRILWSASFLTSRNMRFLRVFPRKGHYKGAPLVVKKTRRLRPACVSGRLRDAGRESPHLTRAPYVTLPAGDSGPNRVSLPDTVATRRACPAWQVPWMRDAAASQVRCVCLLLDENF